MCRGGAEPELAAVVTGMSSIQRWVCSLVNGHVFLCFPFPEVTRANDVTGALSQIPAEDV